MSAATSLQYAYLAYFSRPRAERTLYRTIRRRHVTSIVEMGIGMGVRATRLIRVASRYAGEQRVRYTGIDLFEARDRGRPGWTVKRAHQVLRGLGAKVQLVPGDPFSALARSANQLMRTDLVIISADQDPATLAQAWFYLPRMLHEGSQIFWQLADAPQGAEASFRLLNSAQVAELAMRANESRVRAA